MFKFIVYTILLIIHMFGVTIATIAGLVCATAGAVFVLEDTKTGVLFAIAALIYLGLQRFFIALDPSYMYYEDDW